MADARELKFAGKTLLVLGSNVGSVDIIKYARRNGALTIAADWNPTERSPAKQAADEALLISTGDTGALVEFVKARGVNGVLAGISEFNLRQAMKISEACGLAFYCGQDQWDAVESKERFRALCDQCGVPHPETYFVGDDSDTIPWGEVTFPSILKPVDGSSSMGVYVCNGANEVEERLESSLGQSLVGRVILEEYVSGYEFTAHYAIRGGKAVLLCVDNRYPVSLHDGPVTTIPIARVYPSLFQERYIETVDPSVRKLCQSLGLDDAVMFVQGLYDAQSDRFCIFEAGLRSAGEAPYRFLEPVNGTNYMSSIVDSILLGSTEGPTGLDDPNLKGRCCATVSFVGRGGRIDSMCNLKEVAASVPRVACWEERYHEGDEVPDGDTLRQIMARFVLICDDREQLARDIEALNSATWFLDDKGRDMAVRFDPARLFGLD